MPLFGLLTMKKYRVLPGYEWVTVTGNVPAGEIVELPEHEAAPFIGRVLEEIVQEPETKLSKRK